MSILIVEDEPLVMMVAQSAIEDAGFSVITAEDGPSALAMLAENPNRFSGLIADYNLGSNVTGREVIEAMRRVHPEMPIILASAFPDAVSNEWRWQHDVELLIKPYKIEQLIRIVRQSFRP